MGAWVWLLTEMWRRSDEVLGCKEPTEGWRQATNKGQLYCIGLLQFLIYLTTNTLTPYLCNFSYFFLYSCLFIYLIMYIVWVGETVGNEQQSDKVEPKSLRNALSM